MQDASRKPLIAESEMQMLISYTIYPGGYDSKRNVWRKVTVGMTIAPTPSLSIEAMIKLVDEIQAIIKEMQNTQPINN